MGCGFSSAADKINASDGIEHLNLNENNSATAGNNNTGMGGGNSKASKRKSNHGTISELTTDKKIQNGKNHGRKTTPALSGFPSSPFAIQSEVSSSQVNFFKMLDEKIENGVELEEQDSDQDRHVRLQKVAEEWNDLLGRSQDSHDLQHTKQPPHMEVVAASMEENDGQIQIEAGGPQKPQEGSVDSMRTMFSNSVSLPAGTFREQNSATNPLNT